MTDIHPCHEGCPYIVSVARVRRISDGLEGTPVCLTKRHMENGRVVYDLVVYTARGVEASARSGWEAAE